MSARVWGRWVLVAAALIGFGLAGCGEQTSVTVYKQGKYQGKPDNVPWESAPFAGNKAEWEKAINARISKQNEYARIENQ